MSEPFFKCPDDRERVLAMLAEVGSYRKAALEFGCDKNTIADFVKRCAPEAHAEHMTALTERPEMRLLVIDIETMPGTRFFWDEYERNPRVNPEMIISDKHTAAFAARWVGQDDIEFWSDYHNGHAATVTRAHELLTAADGVITYNGNRFDLPHLNLEFLRNGMGPPRPYKSVDLLRTIRHKFNFSSNKLNRVSKVLGIGSKVEHEGFLLWKKCLAHDDAAWDRMRTYNIHDVHLTDQLYHAVLPWIEGHPSYAAITSAGICPNCGAAELERQPDDYFTKTRGYALYKCGACGKWSRATHSHSRTEITETAMS